jgi:predicted metalloprotease with PDZ domain
MGMVVYDDGTLLDVTYNGPSFKAGLAPGMKITAVNGKQFSINEMKDAIDAAMSSTAPIQLIVANGPQVQTYSVDYHGGMQYPHLVRDESHPDYMSEILHQQAP